MYKRTEGRDGDGGGMIISRSMIIDVLHGFIFNSELRAFMLPKLLIENLSIVCSHFESCRSGALGSGIYLCLL